MLSTQILLSYSEYRCILDLYLMCSNHLRGGMISLFGKTWTRKELEQRTGQMAQIAGIRHVTLQNGPEHGVHVLEFHSGSGLVFSVNIDRDFDLDECSWRGINPTGTRHPSLHEHDGENDFGWLRSFSGMNHFLGKNFAREHNEVRGLDYRESYACDLEIDVIHGVGANDSAMQEIYGICQQPQETYPQPQENWFCLQLYLVPLKYDK